MCCVQCIRTVSNAVLSCFDLCQLATWEDESELLCPEPLEVNDLSEGQKARRPGLLAGSHRWAFNTNTWHPTTLEWEFALTLLSEEETHQVLQFNHSKDRSARRIHRAGLLILNIDLQEARTGLEVDAATSDPHGVRFAVPQH